MVWFLFLQIGENGVSHFAAAYEAAAVGHHVAGAQPGVEGFVDGAFDGVGFGGHVEAVAAHHGGGEDRADGVGLVLPGDIGGGAMDRLVEAAGSFS